MRLLLARHGESVWNETRRLQGAVDVPLSETGRVQARSLAGVLRGRPLAAAYVSPMRRAAETAALALDGAGIAATPIAELRELSLGDWEGCAIGDIRARAGDPYRAWVRAPLDCPPPGAEPLPEVAARVRRAIDAIRARHRDGDDVLVVAHGGVISVYLCGVLGCSLNALWRLRVDNGSLTIVSPPRVLALNDTAHLPKRATATDWPSPPAEKAP